mmetsp:Transcript_15688/g.47311  ORF Transcript_15688/g.47311 Transcript_15688/m.47311 type:complete len:265 (+) Transcript_15688:293-1087(+)
MPRSAICCNACGTLRWRCDSRRWSPGLAVWIPLHEQVEDDLPQVEVHLVTALAVAGGIYAGCCHIEPLFPQHIVLWPRCRQCCRLILHPLLTAGPLEPTHPVDVAIAAGRVVWISGHGIEIYKADCIDAGCPAFDQLVAILQRLHQLLVCEAASGSGHDDDLHLVADAVQVLQPLQRQLVALLHGVHRHHQNQLLPGGHRFSVCLHVLQLPLEPSGVHAIDDDRRVALAAPLHLRRLPEEPRQFLQRGPRLDALDRFVVPAPRY